MHATLAAQVFVFLLHEECLVTVTATPFLHRGRRPMRPKASETSKVCLVSIFHLMFSFDFNVVNIF